MSFFARVSEGELDVVPILWHSYDGATAGIAGVKGKGYELFEASGEAGVVAVASGKAREAARCRVTAKWTKFEKTFTLPDVAGRSITPGHYTGAGFDLASRFTGAVDIANVEVREVKAGAD